MLCLTDVHTIYGTHSQLGCACVQASYLRSVPYHGRHSSLAGIFFRFSAFVLFSLIIRFWQKSEQSYLQKIIKTQSRLGMERADRKSFVFVFLCVCVCFVFFFNGGNLHTCPLNSCNHRSCIATSTTGPSACLDPCNRPIAQR